MPCKTKASPEEMLDQIASYLYQGVTITQAAENLHMSRITFRKWVLRYKEEGFRGLWPRQHLSYYSNQMKIQAVKEYLKGGVSMLSVCAKYRISGTLSLKHGLRRIMSIKLTDLVSEGGDLMAKTPAIGQGRASQNRSGVHRQWMRLQQDSQEVQHVLPNTLHMGKKVQGDGRSWS